MIYYACTYVPVEILIASGLPFQKLEVRESGEDPLIHRNLCGYCKSVYEGVKNLKKDDVYIAVDSCDGMRRTADVLMKNSQAKVFTLRLPWRNDDSAVEFYAGELKRLTEFLSELRGKPITTDELIKGMERFIKLKKHLWKVHREGYSAEELSAALKAAGSGKIYTPESERDSNFLPRIAYFGGIAESVQIGELIRKAGGKMVLNESCGGIRGFTGDYSTPENPLNAISKRLLQSRIPCGRFEVAARKDYEELLMEFEIDGVIFGSPKFCDFYGFVYRNVKISKPSIFVEIDYPLYSGGQLLTRLGAFIETLKKEKMTHVRRGEGKLFVGVDSGSTTTNIVVVDQMGNIIGWRSEKTGRDISKKATELLEDLMSELEFNMNDISYCIATGYGRNIIDFANDAVTEITCHAKGAHRFFPQARSVIDMGGQDSKVIRLDASGKVVDFVMNDKCAAGTGRFLEVMSNVLQLDLGKMSEAAFNSKKIVPISSMCTVFAESEVISLLGKGESVEDISAGLFESIGKRIKAMYRRLKCEPPTVFTGGVARNKGMVRTLEEMLGTSLLIPDVPDIVGAYGAALIAMERMEESERF